MHWYQIKIVNSELRRAHCQAYPPKWHCQRNCHQSGTAIDFVLDIVNACQWSIWLCNWKIVVLLSLEKEIWPGFNLSFLSCANEPFSYAYHLMKVMSSFTIDPTPKSGIARSWKKVSKIAMEVCLFSDTHGTTCCCWQCWRQHCNNVVNVDSSYNWFRTLHLKVLNISTIKMIHQNIY